MKRKIIFISILLVIAGCQDKETDKIDDFFVGVIETTQTKEKSSITFYDSSLNVINIKDYKYADLSSDWSDPVYLDEGILMIPLGVAKKADAKKVVSLDVKNQEFTEFPIDRVNIVCATANDKFVYAGSNLNMSAYITQLNKESEEVKEVELKENGALVSLLVSYKDHLYAFYDYSNDEGINFSGIHIYNENLDLLNTIDLSDFGIGFGKALIYKDKLYIPNEYDSEDNADNRMLILDLVTNDIKSVDFPYFYPNDVVEYHNSIIISHSSKVSPNGSMISVYDVKTEKKLSYDLGVIIRKMDLVENKLVILTADDRLVTYDLDDNFKKSNEVRLEYQSDNQTFKSNIFVNHQRDKK